MPTLLEPPSAQVRPSAPSPTFAEPRFDVRDVYRRHPVDVKTGARPLDVPFAHGWAHRLYRSRVIPLARRRALRAILRRTHADLSWFGPIQHYWQNVLGGRPLVGVQDLYFAKNWLRLRHSSLAVPDTDAPEEHLAAWQRPEALYQLLHLVYKETVADEMEVVGLLQRHADGPVRRLVEYGCATAPVTASLFEFTRPHRDIEVTITDLQSIAFHYGAWRFRRCANVRPVVLNPKNDFQLSPGTSQDAIVCITVAEHLNAPLETFQNFHSMLRPGGVLVFDYIKTDGSSMDTMHAVRQRDAVLDFVGASFRVVHGRLDKTASMGLTVAQRL